MKNSRWILIIIMLGGLWHCTEIPPQINPIDIDTGTGEAQPRSVLVEEYTGVRCVNCPAGSEALQALINIYGDRLAVVSFHAGFFAPPYPESKFDLRTNAGNNLLGFLGEPLGYPAAVVNRRLFMGEQRIQLGQSQWPGYIAQEIAVPPPVEIDLQRKYDAATRQLSLTVRLKVLQTVDTEDVRLSVALTEDNIQDVQLTPTGRQADYLHKHVLRDMITNFDGNLLTEGLRAGAELSRTYNYTLSPNWRAEQCKVIAFVNIGGSRKDVLQVQQTSVVE